MKLIIIYFLVLTSLTSCAQDSTTNEASLSTIQRDTCDGPDADINCCFRSMPEDLTSIMNIAGKDEPGERMVIRGTLFKPDGKTPYPNVIMYAYHTDNKGMYSKKGHEKGIQKWHGHLHGWCRTDKNGFYEIQSIRPLPYPGNEWAAHIHAAIKEPGKEPYYITDFVFEDDPLVGPDYKGNSNFPGGSGIVRLTKDQNGILVGNRDLILK